MKAVLNKISTVLRWIFGYGIMITLFVGGFTFIGYVVALCIGGDTATKICVFIYEEIVPIMVKISTIMILVGLLAMYLSGETALTAGKKNKKKKTDTDNIEKELEELNEKLKNGDITDDEYQAQRAEIVGKK